MGRFSQTQIEQWKIVFGPELVVICVRETAPYISRNLIHKATQTGNGNGS
jgi:hypothetical protein